MDNGEWKMDNGKWKMSGLWTYIKTGGHPYKDAYWREEYERIARDCGVTPDHVFKIACGGPVVLDTDRLVKDELRRCGVLHSLLV